MFFHKKNRNGEKMKNKRKSFADDGWAVWIDGENISSVYMNDWMNSQGKSFVDMAIHIRGVKTSGKLSIFIPFLVSKEEVSDISMLLKNEQNLCAIFGTGCIIDYLKNDCTSEIAYRGRTMDLVHISGVDFTLKPLAGGTVMSVDLEKLKVNLANDEVYFFFRLPHKSLDEMFRREIDVSSVLGRLRDLLTTPVISEKYAYSVRVNEARMLPEEINRIGAFHRQKLKKAAVTILIHEDYDISDQNCYRVRRLEENTYRAFAPDGFANDEVITYQWKQTLEHNKHGYFNFYFTLGKESISRTSMLLYMILLVMMGACGSGLWTLIQFLFG